jgi:hypothetical protein
VSGSHNSRQRLLLSAFHAHDPRQVPTGPQESLGAATNDPIRGIGGATGAQQHLDLVGGPRAQAGHDAVEDQDEGHDGDGVDEEQDARRPPVEQRGDQQDEDAEEQTGDEGRDGSGL